MLFHEKKTGEKLPAGTSIQTYCSTSAKLKLKKMPCRTLDQISGTNTFDMNITFRFNDIMSDICKSSHCLKPPLHCLCATAKN